MSNEAKKQTKKQYGFENAFEHKVIYVFTIHDKAHDGYLKIGDATLHTTSLIDDLKADCHELNQAARKRIDKYTQTAGFSYQLLHTQIAIKPDGGNFKSFRDYEVHAVLKHSGHPYKKINNTTGKEWFEIDLPTAVAAIEAVKKGKVTLDGVVGSVNATPIIFRPEQEDCIKKVTKHFKKSNRFLINAKMRFGKTSVAMEIVRRMRFKKTIIVTHRPVVDEGWYEDFTKIFYRKEDKENYTYGSKKKGSTLETLAAEGKNYIYFASVQDLRGSAQVGGKFDKNDIVFKTEWDCVIVDEAHEGTTTALGEDTIAALVKEKKDTKFLALSGTPFNIMDNYGEDAIYTWDYIMEQQRKNDWEAQNFGDSNPYAELPEMCIYTYDLSKLLNGKYAEELEDKAFNFAEFFRTWKGEEAIDHVKMPSKAHKGDFVHEEDVKKFLDLMTKTNDKNCYPYSNVEYRAIFKHSLWMIPGVAEARALYELMMKHPVFGNGMFTIVNVAGDGNPEDKNQEALTKVRDAIAEADKSGNYTITLSCGKLTTGVTVREWTAVFMLSGSYSTSAAQYLQTIFRVQSPCNMNGKIKEKGYVFDFAPDRTLKMVSEAVMVAKAPAKSGSGATKAIGDFLNYCSVIGYDGSEMKEYQAVQLLEQLKRVYAERAVRRGFEDTSLYNAELFKLDEDALEKFDKLKKIIGASKASDIPNDLIINNQGMDDEQRNSTPKDPNPPKTPKPPKDPEEEKKKKNRVTAISILRGISIRMPLLIYGADIPYTDDLTLEKFVELIDEQSWEEFMPKGVTKEIFKGFQKYYDEAVFVAAGRRIRSMAKETDAMDPTERVIKISSLFSYFKNPDKETVLTPWRVVNMHMSDTLGGWDFYNEERTAILKEPRLVVQPGVTKELFGKPDVKILEINSKTGLYPLYVTYSCYRYKCQQYKAHELTLEKKQELWAEVVADNVFVICKTPMAKKITQRTLLGYVNGKINAHYFEDLINIFKNKQQLFKKKITRGMYWGREDKMKFDAVVGNPPYQESTNSKGNQGIPLYPYFINQAIALKPDYVSMIAPSRWFAGQGSELVKFRNSMMNNKKIDFIVDFTNAKDVFPTISIGGGVFYFRIQPEDRDNCTFTNVHAGVQSTLARPLNEFPVLVRYNEAVNVIHKVLKKSKFMVDSMISSVSPYGIPTTLQGQTEKDKGHTIRLISSKGISFLPVSAVSKGKDSVDTYRVLISQTAAEHAGEASKDGKFKVLASTLAVMEPNDVCSHS